MIKIPRVRKLNVTFMDFPLANLLSLFLYPFKFLHVIKNLECKYKKTRKIDKKKS